MIKSCAYLRSLLKFFLHPLMFNRSSLDGTLQAKTFKEATLKFVQEMFKTCNLKFKKKKIVY